jgi:hypothetical protein
LALVVLEGLVLHLLHPLATCLAPLLLFLNRTLLCLVHLLPVLQLPTRLAPPQALERIFLVASAVSEGLVLLLLLFSLPVLQLPTRLAPPQALERIFLVASAVSEGLVLLLLLLMHLLARCLVLLLRLLPLL